MKLQTHQAFFLKRYKRFFADVKLPNGEEVTAHVPNTGSLKSCLFENQKCLISKSNNPKRKLKYTLEMLKTPTSWVGVNTQKPNELVFEYFLSQKNESWKKFPYGQKEVKINEKSRIDLVLTKTSEKLTSKNFKNNKCHFIEIKNVTLKEKESALFPDAVSLRGQKHIKELIELMKKGHSAEMVFVVQRQDCKYFQTADDIDPDYGRLLKKAYQKGLKVSIFSCSFKTNRN